MMLDSAKANGLSVQDPGNERMKEIGAAIREGAMAFLTREYKVLSVFIVIVAVLLVVTNEGPQQLVRYLLLSDLFVRDSQGILVSIAAIYPSIGIY